MSRWPRWGATFFGVAALAGLTPRPTSAGSATETRIHEVQPGESLWVIAANTIGDPRLWPALYRANRDQIKDPTLLYPGQKLAIPEVDPAEREQVRREAAAMSAK